MNIDKNASIIDVRTPGEYAGQHVPGAINIPLDELTTRMDEIKDLPKPVVAYCKTGNRSGIAVGMMKQHGIMDAVNGGGIGEMLVIIK